MPGATYLVGGAVRDRLLGRPCADRDFVVVGSTPEAMVARGFRPVGKDFPVFIDPATGEEHALARTERKSGRGYHGFAFHASPEVTLEDDLRRRDLTVNAIAQAPDGSLVDPFGGVRDIEARVLRHVSPAFAEDPLRVLRVARFAARFAPLGFTIASETLALMGDIVDAGEVSDLVSGRVWQETQRALGEASPGTYVRVLRACGALAVLFPEVDALYGVPQRPEYHPEVDTGTHIELVLDMAARLAPGNALVGYCALVHDLGKGVTPREELPKHVQHEKHGVPLVRAVNERYKVPYEYGACGVLACKLHLIAHQALELKPSTVVRLFDRLDAFRRADRLEVFLLACEADKRGRTGLAERPYPQADYLRACFAAARGITAAPFVAAGLEGVAIGEAMSRARIGAVAAVAKPTPERHL
ncbi:MAG TPA: multifunctional CCA addition/repair protein [Candidatus Saccharimonadia bacterium]|nr:multifunctional CCA addition/repair protein [Candidatus Saccharimonadia bacterium]